MIRKTTTFIFALIVFGNFTGVPLQGYSEQGDVQNPKLKAYFIDVGMGDAIFLDIPPKDCMLIDAGSWDNDGIDNLMGFLDEFFGDPEHKAYNKTIDVAVATHQHKDHIQGMLNVLKKYKVTSYIDNGVGWKYNKSEATDLMIQVGDLIKSKKVKHYYYNDSLISAKGKKGVYTDGVIDPFSGVDIFVLGATPDPVDSKENNNSIVLKAQCGDISFLLTGDAETKEERRITEKLKTYDNAEALNVDVYKAGHHGSNTATGEEFIELASPSISVVSVGVAEESPKTRDFRLPKESVVKRLDKQTANSMEETWNVQAFPDKKPKGAKNEKPKMYSSRKEIYFTSSDGTILFATDGKKLETELYEREQ